MIDQKQPENVEYFNYLDSIIINVGRCTCEIIARISTSKTAFHKKKTLFPSYLDFNLRKKFVKRYT
jgi:hypothetical protein